MTDFEEALKNISPSVSNSYLKEYEDWMKEQIFVVISFLIEIRD